MTYLKVRKQYDPTLRNTIKKRKIVAVVPVGSIEQHGKHLPISTDSDIVTVIAKKISQKGNYLLLPTISYGVSFEHAPMFNISVRQSILKSILTDICRSLFDNGIHTIFILNGHHGNQNALRSLEKKFSTKKNNVFVFSYWHFMEQRFDHAGFVETSIMLAIEPKNVKMNKAKKGLVTEELPRREVQRLNRLASRSFPSATKSGIWGDPTKASAKKGKKMMAEITQNLYKMCQSCLTGKISKLHQ